MSTYEKPSILVVDDTSEGVYAASGAAASSSSSASSVTVKLNRFDHFGNYYFDVNGLENGITYTITVTVNETATVHGLTSASWQGSGGTVAGNVVTFTGVCYANQTDWHIRLWFESQGNWENGWQLADSDIPSLNINVAKVG